MKLDTFSKFVLLMIHFTQTNANHESEMIKYSTTNSESEMIDYSRTLPNFDMRSIPTTLLYVVGVLNKWGPEQGVTYGGQKACTGTLIRHDMVLTLASCVLYDQHLDPDPTTILIKERPNNILTVLKIYINPNFYSDNRHIKKIHDCGLIVVEKSVQSVFPKLPQSVRPFSSIKSTCLLAGYGTEKVFHLRNFKEYKMSETNATVYTGRACSGKDLFCIHFPNLVPCSSDYGSAMICDGVLYAMYIPRLHSSLYTNLNFRNNCMDLYLTVFSPVYNVKDWVAQVMDAPTSKLEWLNNPWYILLLCFIVFIAMGGIYLCIVEVLQRYLDPAEGMEMVAARYSDDSGEEDSWYDSQWTK